MDNLTGQNSRLTIVSRSKFARTLQSLCALLFLFSLNSCGIPVGGEDGAVQNVSIAYLSSSTALRTYGSGDPVSVAEESTRPSYYRDTPAATDLDIRSGGVQDLTASFTSDCGLTGSVSDRIADCASTYSASATWIGSEKGIFGEGSWTLVSRDASNNAAVWRDDNTLLLWTDVVARGVHYCKAAGVNQSSFGSSFCSINNASPESYCAEVSGFANLGETAKAELDDVGEKVYWRLPTRGDLIRGDLNGLRYVFGFDRDNSTGDKFWAATSWAGDPSQAWSMAASGTLTTTGISAGSNDVICVGSYKK